MATVKKKIQKKSGPVAKGKKRAERMTEEEKAIKEFEKKAVKVHESADPKVSRSDVESKEIVNVIADVIEEVYSEYGAKINRLNARDKALIIYRELRYNRGVKFREKNFKAKVCDRHG